MKFVKIAALVVLVLALVVAFIAPIGPLPGVFIGGTASPAPTRWGDTSDVEEIQLKVPGTPPRVVVVWVIQHDGELHVVGSADSGWVTMIGAGSPVQLRMGDKTYALTAQPVADQWQPIVEAYVAKYAADYPDIVAGFPTIDEAQGQIAVFRLTRA